MYKLILSKMNIHRKAILMSALLVYILILSCINSYGLFVKDYTIKELTNSSDAVITGTVLKYESKWNSDKNFIFSYITIEVEKYIIEPSYHPEQLFDNMTISGKNEGLGNNIITIRILGGQPEGENTSQTVEDEPNFSVGEKCLLFLKNDFGGIGPTFQKGKDFTADYTVNSDAQGKMKITDDEKIYDPDSKNMIDLEDMITRIDKANQANR